MKNKNLKVMIDTWSLSPYKVLNESESARYQNESSFQAAYANIHSSNLSPKVLCVIEGRFGKNRATSVNGRYYGEGFWDRQLAKEETKFLLRKGLMYMMFGHVDRGIEDKDVEKGLVAGIVTHLEVIKAPTTINGVSYNAGDLFGRAIIIDMEAGRNTYTLLSVGSEISISSRGLGEYVIGETHTCEDGTQIPIMNSITYELETFDFTRLPGISDAEVHTVRDNLVSNDSIPETDENEDDDFSLESLDIEDSALSSVNESLSSLIFNINKKENNMAKVDGIKVQQVLEDANAKIASQSAEIESLKRRCEEAEAEKEAEKARADELEKKLEETPETVEAGVEPQEPEQAAAVEQEAKAEVEEPATVDTSELDKFKAIAETPEELEATLIKVEETLKACKEDAEELEKCRMEKEEAEEKLAEVEKDNKEATEVLEAYVKLGSIAELTAMVESHKKLAAESRKQKLSQFASFYSNKKGITLESVKRIIDSSKSISAAKAVLESLPNVKADKGLYKSETAAKHIEKPALSSFAESFITKSENRRNRTYTV